MTQNRKLTYEIVDGMASGAGPSFSEDWIPVVFSRLPTGTECVYIGMRAAPKIA
ncbi:hypothetical protein [Amycolatopsis regifaucium]|uniref:hypothetical protein n=1 Tax=Amycolatopsis regifaucium TaxID=546365 RepID=UPI001FCA128D|nr:hypothetical protein [Amycolatopsis regifaucium]